MPIPALLAHVGGMGWDELLVMVVPIAIVLALRAVGRRKAAERAEAPDMLDGPPQ